MTAIQTLVQKLSSPGPDRSYGTLVQTCSSCDFSQHDPDFSFNLVNSLYTNLRYEAERNNNGVESGKAVALVSTDISAPAGYLPRTALDEIFKKAHGSVAYTHPTEGWTRYIVPCNDTLKITYTIGGAQYPIHPLDFTQFWEDRPESLKDYTVCISTVRSYEGSKADHDISLGAAFLRNVYSIFDFGDSQEDGTLGEPYLQFLPQWTHGDGDHWKDLHRNMDGRPPELEPAKVVQILSSSSSGSSSDSGTSSNKSTNKPEAHSGSNHKTGSDIDGGNILTSANSANRPASSSSGSSIDRFMPAVIALLAVNLIIGLILAVLSVLNYIKKNGAAKKAGIPHYIPVSKRDQVLFDANDNPSGHANRYGYSSMSE
ncbi:hypothetical protein CC1G_07768 [Coprinopsis cinerea okayama7|uniref:Peptidase A1 domain-containing protein n=1 Tax=Coprinopsis cinerea (strain Okayama-7 / 130 / ATCC MYA-4618 / FGSC 9003) TaxID=240176 RepID=A8NNY6_COPC7|nr:hypothetical protein CC1G_07768 [Coprinopsis cinerea okayama7\|eukprot:XP_001835225.1 hypothetical protein CC1G_07768 [Coprinopsis cinerea okayama7\